MSLSEDLIRHTFRLLGNPPGIPGTPDAVELRRAVSSSYYALFHRLCESAVSQVAPSAPAATANRIHRWFEHAEMKRICREFAAVPLRTPLRELLEQGTSNDMQVVANGFVQLQEARQRADYDLEYGLTWEQAAALIGLAVKAMEAWENVRNTAEGNIFVLSLLLWKIWTKER